MRFLRRAISLEAEEVDGKARPEIELTYYGKILDMADLLSAQEKEHQEQWNIVLPHTAENAGSGSIRVRKTIPAISNKDAAFYVLTTKVQTGITGKQIETSVASSEDQFASFKVLANSGMIKDRYTFGIPDSKLVWQFDLFYQFGAPVGSGQSQPWVKIDIEVPSLDVEIPKLPIRVTELITTQRGSHTPEVDKLIGSLYEHYFTTPNEILNKGK